MREQAGNEATKGEEGGSHGEINQRNHIQEHCSLLRGQVIENMGLFGSFSQVSDPPWWPWWP